MQHHLPISTAIISVYRKDGLAPLVSCLHSHGVALISTGGTADFIADMGIPVLEIGEITGFPEILGGRVKTLHPKVFGGILHRRENREDLITVQHHEIPRIDLVVVDLYPFEETVKATQDEATIIEKIDIGGVSLLRAAAKNYQDVVVLSDIRQYPAFIDHFILHEGKTTRSERKSLARAAFGKTYAYDQAIHHYFQESLPGQTTLRYGENPHQKAHFEGNLTGLFKQLNGKEISYNNLLDIDAAWRLMKDFPKETPFFAIIKHNNPCGLALAETLEQAYDWALSADPISAFGGVLITNQVISNACAEKIHPLFFEVLLAPDYQVQALTLLQNKANRILLKMNDFEWPKIQERTILNGKLIQEADDVIVPKEDWKLATQRAVTLQETEDLFMANVIAKHTKSNAIAIVKSGRMLACGTGQTSRVDALQQALEKAKSFGLDVEGAVMASDAFFPFPDCVEIAAKAGISAIIQPGGSIKDALSIEACDRLGVAMVFSAFRHFKH